MIDHVRCPIMLRRAFEPSAAAKSHSVRCAAYLLSLSALLTFSGVRVAAHPPDQYGSHDEGGPVRHAPTAMRTWTNARTGEATRGAFLAACENLISIERENGGIVTIPLADLAADDRAVAEQRVAEIEELNEFFVAVAQDEHQPPAPAGDGKPLKENRPPQAAPFDRFAPFVKTRWDARWLYIESDGLPHAPFTYPLMVGIKSWQQQVPLPQAYVGENAWQIPLQPELADKPISARTQLYRGAIALAANGVPIFNALNNRGDDALRAGELDAYGGHAGRADDYHYHIAPLALQKVLGKEKPIAYALDGFPLYGLFDPAAKKGEENACTLGGREKLDELNGHCGVNADGSRGLYHYHASKTYPYINGGMRGKVSVKDDQIDPQPRAQTVRQWLTPLRGASITGFKSVGEESWSLEYTLEGKKHFVNFRAGGAGKYMFEFVGPDGAKQVETYSAPAGPPRSDPPERPGERKRRGGPNERPPPDAARPSDERGRPPEGGQKAPWIIVHAKEIDTNVDGVITREELIEQARLAFEAYDVNKDGTLFPDEYDRSKGAKPPRLPMGGFVQLHARELDANGDGSIARDEMLTEAGRIFDKSDRNADGKLTGEELAASNSAEPPSADPKSAERGSRGRRGRDRDPDGARDGREGGGLLGELMGTFHTDVPAHPFDLILVRPTPTSIAVSAASQTDCEGFVEFGASAGVYPHHTETQALHAGVPALFTLTGLRRDRAYVYRWRYRAADEHATGTAREFAASDEYSFHTPRAAGDTFTFAIQADSHLDYNMNPAVYVQTLANALADNPDFLVDLGDTFMTDKRRDFHDALPQYVAQRYYFSRLCCSAALFMVLGNHDGEYGYGAGGPGSIANWSYAQRTKFFPPPLTDGAKSSMYSGRTGLADGRGSNYYAFEWGDALFVVLDPFWPTRERSRGGGGRGRDGEASGEDTDQNWSRTLGREQYDWLDRTLSASKAKFKFVFTHHLVGGSGKDARGGVEAAPFFEWGGKNAGGSPGFAGHRPGWPMPIHSLLVKRGVTAVFHGHDHLYVRNELDGIVYQCVPQPGNPRGGTRSAEEYGYKSGTIFGSPGHLRVTVSPSAANVAYVRSSIESSGPSRRAGDETNGVVVTQYALKPRGCD